MYPAFFWGEEDIISVDEMHFFESFHDAIQDGDDAKAEDVIDKGPPNIVNKVIDGIPTSLLGMACKSDARSGIVKVMLEEFGADPNLEVYESPLHIACLHGCEDIVKVLLQNKANPNQLSNEITPIAAAALNGHIHIIRLLLHESPSDVLDINLGPYNAVVFSIHNDHDECLDFLLENGAEASLGMKHPQTKEFPLQQACKKGLVKGLPLVTTILKHIGDLSIDRVNQLQDPTSTDVFIKTYASLSNKLLSRCISRALLKYDYDREASNYPDTANPLLACIKLAELVRDKWRQVRRSNPHYCNELNTLFNNLQLGGAYILEEMYQDQDRVNLHGGKIVKKTKEENLRAFLKIESSRRAIQIAHKIQSRIFFNQPVVYNFINRNWYGTDIMTEIFLDQNKSNVEAIMQMIGFVGLLLPLNLLPILLQGTPFQNRLLQLISKIRIPMRCFCLKSKDPWIFTSPVIIFVVQCVFDLGLALMFTFINVNDATAICFNNDCNVRVNGIVPWLILFFTLGILSWEIKDLIVENLLAPSTSSTNRGGGCVGIFFDIPRALKDYFRNDPFNFFDFPGSLLAFCSLVLGLYGVSGGGIVVMQSLGCLFLWLRLLRVLTLHPTAGSLVLMFFKMSTMIILWLFILIIIVLAFASSIYKLSFASGIDPRYGNQYSYNEEICELVSSNVMFRQFFEDAISGGGSALLDCRDTSSLGKFFGLVSYGNFMIYLSILLCQVLLLNMLIAMMNEAFSTIFDAQEANYTYQRVRHFLEIAGGEDWTPQHSIQVFYFPCGLCEMGMYCFKRFNCDGTYALAEPKVGNDREFGDKEELDEATNLFYDYICEHQDEVTDDDRWRLRLMKKITDLKLEQDEKFNTIDEKFNKMDKRFEEQEKRFKKELESVVGQKFDKLLNMMKQVLEKEP